MKKHLFPFQYRVEFLGLNSPLLFEGGDGGGLGFYLFIFLLLLRFVKFLLFFLTFEGEEGMVFLHFSFVHS